MKVSDRARDRVLAVGAAAFAASCVSAARGIEDSLLSDAVGAGGVPQGVGIAMGVAALALFIKSFAAAPQLEEQVEKSPQSGAVDDVSNQARPGAATVLLRSGGLVLILIGYGLLLPLLGYALSVSLLVLASGRLAGAPLRTTLLLCAAVVGPALWLLFDQALQVRMPVGRLWS